MSELSQHRIADEMNRLPAQRRDDRIRIGASSPFCGPAFDLGGGGLSEEEAAVPCLLKRAGLWTQADTVSILSRPTGAAV